MARKIFSYYGRSEYHNKMLKIFAGMSLLQGAFFFLAAHMVVLRLESMVSDGRIPASTTDFANLLKQHETFLYLMVLGSVMVSTMVFVYMGMRFSHDAVGAIYRMKKDLMQMTESNDIKRLNMRKNDYFKDVEEVINNLIDRLKNSPPKE